MARSCCPDCDRWRCICAQWEEQGAPIEQDQSSVRKPALPGVVRLEADNRCNPSPARTAPPSPAMRAILERLRAEFADRAARAPRV